MEGHIVLPPLGQTEWTLLWAVLASAFVAMGYGWYLVRRVLAEDPGTKKMQEIARAIEEGAMAYLGRQVRTMIWFVVLMAAGLFFMYYSVTKPLHRNVKHIKCVTLFYVIFIHLVCRECLDL